MDKTVIVGAIGALLLITACSSSDDESATTTPATTEVLAAATTTAAVTTTEPAAAATTEQPAPTTTEAPATTTPEPAPEPVAWTAVEPGPYQIGVTTVTIDDPAGERPLTVDVWFPLSPAIDADLAPQRYTLLPGVYYESPRALAATSDLIAGDGPYPLVVYSHGSGGLRYLHSSYTEVLASHGHVVVGADHTGNTAIDLLAGVEPEQGVIPLARPTDVRRLIDAFLDPAEPATAAFANHVDGEQVVVTGHSAGGFTALASVLGFENELGESPADDRVDAIVLLAPAVGAFPDDTLAMLDVPMMVLVGTDDITTPVDPNVTSLWDNASNSPAYRVELVAGEHQTFTDLCAYQESLPLLPDVPQLIVDTIDDFGTEGCSPGDIDRVRAEELTNSYVLRFLDEVLRDGPPIDPAVVATPDDVIFDSR